MVSEVSVMVAWPGGFWAYGEAVYHDVRKMFVSLQPGRRNTERGKGRGRDRKRERRKEEVKEGWGRERGRGKERGGRKVERERERERDWHGHITSYLFLPTKPQLLKFPTPSNSTTCLGSGL
jgi:hypothetical protein